MEQHTARFEFIINYVIPILLVIGLILAVWSVIHGYRNRRPESFFSGIIGSIAMIGAISWFYFYGHPEMASSWEVVRKFKQRENPSNTMLYISLIPLILLGIRSAFKLRTSK